MYSAIVVDDESIIRNGISSFVNRCGSGFEVINTFKDGSEAIDFLEENDVDLVISDVKMSNISGLGLAQYIYENKPYIMIIILSGYAEFEYAKTAIKYNVREYITKPTNFKELKNILLKLSSELDKKKLSEKKRFNIDIFLDNINQLYTAVLSCNEDEALALLKQLLDKNTHNNEQLGQYAFNIFELISDHIYTILKTRVFSDQKDHKSLPSISDRSKIYEVSMQLISCIISQIKANSNKTDDMVLSKLLQYIDDHFGENISLQTIADKVFFSTAYCSRFFKEKTGKNFSDYLLDVRMKHAVKLLHENKKISEISRECGYRNSSYFTRVFREYYHCTPTEYVRSN